MNVTPRTRSGIDTTTKFRMGTEFGWNGAIRARSEKVVVKVAGTILVVEEVPVEIHVAEVGGTIHVAAGETLEVEAEAVNIFRGSLIDAYNCHLAGKLIATVEQAALEQITYGRNQRSPRPRCGSRRHTPPSARAPRSPPLALSPSLHDRL